MANQPLAIVLETGTKKVFASGIQWPGWSRAAKDETSARQALVEYGPRYARAMLLGGLTFFPPAGPEQLTVLERLSGNATTDFGAPNIPLPADAAPIQPDELARLQQILTACWLALEQAARAAQGKQLRTGPRGGGRSLDGIIDHVLGAEANYLSRINWKIDPLPDPDLFARLAHLREQSLHAFAAAVQQGLPESGPRGGKYWLPRTYVRRSAWHILDHAWEIEDRSLG